MKEISHINFTKIKMLDVSFNNIDSIEGLNRIHLPTIEVLHLSKFLFNSDNNEIAFFQELKKVQFPKLTELRIGEIMMDI